MYPVEQLDKDLRLVRFSIPLNRAVIPIEQAGTRLNYKLAVKAKGVQSRRITIQGPRARKVPIEIFSLSDSPQQAGVPDAGNGLSGEHGGKPALFFIHGGGFILGAASHHKKLICDYVLGTGCIAVSPDYALAPGHPYPEGLEDCLAAYGWLMENSASLGVDSSRVGLCGDSAGACLAAVLARMLRDRSRDPERPLNPRSPLFQMLIYPVSAVNADTASMRAYTDTPNWNAPLNRKMWMYYLGSENADIASSRGPDAEKGSFDYRSPLSTSDFSGLPDTYIETAEFDCLRDEGLELCRKLKEAGNKCELVQSRGTVHGFEAVYWSACVKQALASRIAYMRSEFFKG